jgi:hypothetical protein
MTTQKRKKTKASGEKNIVSVASDLVAGVEELTGAAEKQLEDVVAPVRESVIKRFPILFLLAVTFGLTATLTGIEQILFKFELLQTYPTIILVMGIGTLVLTGTLYKKLG